MAYQIDLSDEELDELDLVLRQEFRSTRIELRRTRNPEYRGEVRHHMDLVEHILESLGSAKSRSGTAAGPS